MGILENIVLIVYYIGLLIFLGLVLRFVFLRFSKQALHFPTKVDNIEKLSYSKEKTDLLMVGVDSGVYQIADESRAVKRAKYADVDEISGLAMDMNIGILEANRSSERRLTKAQAEELLEILRNELALQKTDASPEKMIQSVRVRLIQLTEMLAEAQIGLSEMNHRVVDIETIVKQLPKILNNHRDHIYSLYQSVNELIESTATKSEVKVIEKELGTLKWVFTGVLGIVLAIMGWILSALMANSHLLK